MDTEKNRGKSTNCYSHVTCVDVYCQVAYINFFGIQLVLCDWPVYLTRFDLTKGFLFDTSFIAVFTNFVVVVTEYLNSNHFQYQSICKPSKTLKSNVP